MRTYLKQSLKQLLASSSPFIKAAGCFAWGSDTHEQALRHTPPCECYLAHDSGGEVALALVATEGVLKDELLMVYVHPGYRGRGVCRELLAHIVYDRGVLLKSVPMSQEGFELMQHCRDYFEPFTPRQNLPSCKNKESYMHEIRSLMRGVQGEYDPAL
jgi:hypothetical protein